eukprot:gnl/TRDRNA2_/TRDRNA2_148991_c0_seq2.p1 gnl/TRDRNA2_/TRDRNA2_148991_c0~~gnl/TRDRNA2_/TRDRNA2_148991_c0_seq2.p1  ORF type:complete len:126 (-),score=12.74 gnl/TRDRNA2_/TRDRNA2_148991_c0_seq2:559-936(-)
MTQNHNIACTMSPVPGLRHISNAHCSAATPKCTENHRNDILLCPLASVHVTYPKQPQSAGQGALQQTSTDSLHLAVAAQALDDVCERFVRFLCPGQARMRAGWTSKERRGPAHCLHAHGRAQDAR